MLRLKHFAYNIILSLIKLYPYKPQKFNLVLIKTDEIGDYVLWRNSLPFFREGRYKGYKITLIGNAAWKNLFDHYDKEFVDEVIWFDKKSFKSNLFYRYRFLRNIRKAGFEILINCIFSRSKRLDDAIVIGSGVKEKVGYRGDTSNQPEFEIGYDKNLYTRQFMAAEVNTFEVKRNFQFSSFVTGKPLTSPFLSFSEIEKPADALLLPLKYIVVFPGSGHPSKRWKPEFFAKVAKEVYEQYQLPALICGAGNDAEAINNLIPLLTSPFVNLYNKLTLSSFLSVLQQASFLISIDTSAVHLAAATGCMIFGLFNGTHYGRFSPYPPEIADKVFSIYPDVVEKELKESPTLPEKYRLISGVDYNLIPPEKVLSIIREKFKNQG